jgi:hypothetical protein
MPRTRETRCLLLVSALSTNDQSYFLRAQTADRSCFPAMAIGAAQEFVNLFFLQFIAFRGYDAAQVPYQLNPGAAIRPHYATTLV